MVLVICVLLDSLEETHSYQLLEEGLDEGLRDAGIFESLKDGISTEIWLLRHIVSNEVSRALSEFPIYDDLGGKGGGSVVLGKPH